MPPRRRPKQAGQQPAQSARTAAIRNSSKRDADGAEISASDNNNNNNTGTGDTSHGHVGKNAASTAATASSTSHPSNSTATSAAKDPPVHNHSHHSHHHHHHQQQANEIFAASTNTASTSKQLSTTLAAATSAAAAASAADKSNSTLVVDDSSCLHCHAPSTEVQVRCDECSCYICNTCHWCHEFQANHEIRVCDRCDAFYCRACDEMDQCDDCGEVVCAACSTLLSCKFCGGGLCEECATACGRCGIVLCSRDAKFAVDCDTCRLSYCLVCLASGSKDPCVRCGHRPSKRMEQLVHLRLKSIYKAFKQSSSGRSSSDSGGGPLAPSSRIEELNDGDDDEIPDLVDGSEHCSTDDPQTLLQAAASAAKMVAAEARHEHDHVSAEENVARYMEEKEKADAAAADLLAELEEEENLIQTKKSKKKRKKARLHAKKEEEVVVVRKHDDDVDVDEDADATSTADSTELDQKPAAEATQEDLSVEEEVVESIDDAAEPPSDVPDGVDLGDKFEEKEIKVDPLTDPLEQKLCVLVADADIDGLEELLGSIKGVPGRAALRKNAKKALKRLRLEENGSDALDLQSESHEVVIDNRSGADTPTFEAETSGATSDLLKVVSYMHNKPAAQPAATGNSRPRSASTAGRSECVMHMAPFIVGWVIGKGGQRIRDLMEESGARVWIDQDSMGVQDPRIVYVSGNRSNVDVAVQMIKELVSKAPAGTPVSRRNTPLQDTTALSKHPPTSSKPPLMPDSTDMMAHGERLGLKPRENVSSSEAPHRPSVQVETSGRSKHVMTCDPRFVPLLIGRRGWTIKHIQDSSGARVDIDQTVTPRKITLSGSEDNVQIAIRMVSDVLSYPHSQLQGAVEGEGPTESNGESQVPHMPSDIHEVVGMQRDHPTPVQHMSPAVSAELRPHSPPPSSLILTGDAKSTISASSSLSSTPEPSMSAAAKGPYHQVAPGPMLPPAYGPGQFAPSRNDMAPSSFNRMQPPSPMGNGPMSNAPIFPAGLGMPTQESLFGPPPPSTDFLQQQVQIGPVGGPMIPEQHHGNHMGQAPQSYAPRQDMPPFHQAPAHGFGPIPGNNQMPMHQHSAFHPSQQGFQMSTPESQRSVLNDIGEPGNRSGPSPGGMWDLPSPHHGAESSMPQLPGSQGFRLDAAVDFLEHSKQQRSNSIPLPTGVNGLLGISGHGVESAPIGLVRKHSSPPEMLHRTGDESLMVDSLFAPAETGRNDSNILTGLQGLSISDEDLGGGLWGSSNAGNGDGGLEILSLPVGEHGDDREDQSGLFADLATHEQHPPQSRFAWGAPREGFG